MLKKEKKAYDQKRNKLYYLKESINVFVQYRIGLFFKLTAYGISNSSRYIRRLLVKKWLEIVKIQITVIFHNLMIYYRRNRTLLVI